MHAPLSICTLEARCSFTHAQARPALCMEGRPPTMYSVQPKVHKNKSMQQQSSSSSSNRFIEHNVSTRKLGPSSEFPGRNVVFNKAIAGRRRTLLLTVKPARMSVKRVCNSRSFGYGCCHGRISSSQSLPTSVGTGKKNI